MTTTTTRESYVVYELEPEPFPGAHGRDRVGVSSATFDEHDKKFATFICLFVIITSVVLICLFYLLGHSFGYVLLIILLVLTVTLVFAYWTRRPLFLFGLRPTTSVKIPNYALHVIPAVELMQNNNNNNASTNSGFFVYPYPTNIHPAPVYKTQTKTID